MAAITAIVSTGCGDTSEEGSPATSPEASPATSPEASDSASSAPAPTESEEPGEEASDEDAIEIEIEGDKITPNGERVTLKTGQPVRLEIESDRAGELHVHSTPDEELAFGKGKTTLELTIDTPGVVDVEEHETGLVVLQLEVS